MRQEGKFTPTRSLTDQELDAVLSRLDDETAASVRFTVDALKAKMAVSDARTAVLRANITAASKHVAAQRHQLKHVHAKLDRDPYTEVRQARRDRGEAVNARNEAVRLCKEATAREVALREALLIAFDTIHPVGDDDHSRTVCAFCEGRQSAKDPYQVDHEADCGWMKITAALALGAKRGVIP